MKSVYTFFTALLLSVVTYGQITITEVLMPQYIQNSGLDASELAKVPFVCRLTINGLNPNATYRYFNRFVKEADTVATSTTTGGGYYTLVNASTATFTRVTLTPAFTAPARYLEFTSSASGSYTGWFMGEPLASSTFEVGIKVFMRIYLNDGLGGSVVSKRIAAPSPIIVIPFDNTPYYINNGTPTTVPNGTAIRSTPATNATAKNFVMLFDNPAGNGRPLTGTVVEGDGVANTIANAYAPFYSAQVNEVNKAWGTIIPNTIAGGIKRISQYSLTTGVEVGYKISSSGNWPKEGGGTVSTANTNGGMSNVIVLDGSILTLAEPIMISQLITFDALPSKTYGDPDFAPGATINTNLPISYSSSNPAVATIVNGMIHITGAGTTDITAQQDGDDDHAPAIPVTRTLIVTKKTVTVTAQDATILQGDAIPTFTIIYSGFVNGENESILITSATGTTTVTNSNTVGTYPITPAGAAAANYDFIYVNGTLTITAAQQPQTITFNTLATKTYGDAAFGTGATASSNLALSYVSSDPAVATVDNNGMIHIAGAGTTTITASQGGNNAFFPATPVSQTLTVVPAPLTITAEDKSRLVGQPNPVLTVIYSGFVYGETSSIVSAPPVIATTATVASAVGVYPITVDGAAAANYTITFVSGALTVVPLPSQTITFNVPPVKRYGDPDFAPGAIASSGLAVVYTSSNLQVATITNGVIHLTGAGTVDITASQPGDPFNAAAPPVTHTLTVLKANLSIVALDTSKYEGQPNPVFSVQYAGFVNGDDASDLATQPVITSTATTTSLMGNYPVMVTGASSPNYNIAQLEAVLKVLPANGSDQDMVTAFLSGPGKLRVNYYATAEENVNLQLFDSYGNRLINARLHASKGFNTWYFDVSNITAGVYPVRIAGKGGLVQTKVIIR